MPQVFYRSPRHEYPRAQNAEGCWITDNKGHRYLDGSSGAAVSTLGHGNTHVIDAIKAQASKMAYAHTSFFTNEPQEILAKKIAAKFHALDPRVYFTSGGSEATETALKLARQYQLACGNSDKSVIISRQGSYHGATLGALGVSGTRRRAPFEPLLTSGPRISACYAYRHKELDETLEAYGLRAANELETAILKTGRERVAAFIAEPVVGSTLGAVSAVPGYFKRIREICTKYGVLLICDEVMTGACRTGPYLASDIDAAQPDIVVLGKGLGAGYQPLGAVVCRSEIHEMLSQSPNVFDHGHTYIGHAIACAAGVAVLEELDRIKAGERAVKLGASLKNMLGDALSSHPNVGDIRGRGLMIGVEFVEDKAAKTPFSNSRNFPSLIKKTALNNGLMCYPDGGNVGEHGAHILLAPPLIITDAELGELTDRLTQAVYTLLPNTAHV